MENYDNVYGTKPLGSTEIRVLRLEPTSAQDLSALEDTVVATTEIVCLDDHPEFTALSYCWGTGGFNKTMVCDGSEMKITESLFNALRWFRLHVGDESRNADVGIRKLPSLVIWADAVCINQMNIAERNAQVQLMGTIYSQAKLVFIYLGEETAHMSAGLALAGDIWTMAYEHAQDNLAMNSDEALRSLSIPRNELSGWKGLVDIFTCPWFSRCWIMQEFCMCENRMFVCGGITFPWFLLDTVVRLIDANPEASTLVAQTIENKLQRKSARFWDTYYLNCLFTLRDIAGTVAPDEWFERLRNTKTPLARFTLWQLLIASGSKFEATNPRDKIYALLGMAKDADVLPKPDYSLSVGETYTMYAKHWIATGHGADVISVAGLQRSDIDMPSWVPDWSTHPWPLSWNPFDNIQDPTANASKGLEEDVQLDTSTSRLLVKGAIIDKINRLSRPMIESDIGQSVDHRAWIKSARDVLQVSYPELSPAAVTNIISTIITAGDPDVVVDDSSLAFRTLEDVAARYVHLNMMVNPSPLELLLVKYQIYILSAVSIMSGTVLFVTEKRRVGLAPNPTNLGDDICIFAGGKTPYALRPKDESHILVGKAYVRDFMQGEALEEPGFSLQMITLD